MAPTNISVRGLSGYLEANPPENFSQGCEAGRRPHSNLIQGRRKNSGNVKFTPRRPKRSSAPGGCDG